MPLTSTNVRELAELESRAAAKIREKLPYIVIGDERWMAARTGDMRSAAFMDIAEEMDAGGLDLQWKKS